MSCGGYGLCRTQCLAVLPKVTRQVGLEAIFDAPAAEEAVCADVAPAAE